MNAGAGVLLGLIGIPVGSFLNVVVERTPGRLPLRGPGPEGDEPIRQWGPVPVQPWLLRGGDPADRRPRWLVVELATAAVFAAYGTRFGDSTIVLPLLVLGACLVAISAIDLEHLRIPDRVTFPALAVAAPLMVIVSVQHHVPGALKGAIVGSLAYFFLLLLPHLAYPRGMGFGDVKLALLMGLFLGWLGWRPDDQAFGPIRLVAYGLMIGCVAGVVFGLGHRQVTKQRGEFPFGPALAAACIFVTIWLP